MPSPGNALRSEKKSNTVAQKCKTVGKQALPAREKNNTVGVEALWVNKKRNGVA